MDRTVGAGRPYPLGASLLDGGVNFSLFSKHAERVEIHLFDPGGGPPTRVIPLDPLRNRTFYYWHACVPGIGHGQLYGIRAHGPFQPDWGLRFDASKLLLDPYSRAVMVDERYRRRDAERHGQDNGATAMKSVVVDPSLYDWEADEPLHRPFNEMIIYELHVRGLTQDPSSGVSPSLRGTYAGLTEKIPYLQSLGVTAVELLPVQQFDPQEAPGGRFNYWGYNPIAFLAPHRGYSSDQSPTGPVDEFRDMVKALHRAGIEVILDVVFNHSAEGDHRGPTLSFRGLSNRAYYLLEANRARYANYSGCGNTIKCNHSIVRRLIIDALRYWVQEMHVDGFRFDLASIMSRDEFGRPIENPPILWEIESDPVLAGTKIIAEAWDAAGLYQVGSFVGHRWAEWNGQFRDDARRFVKGDEGMAIPLAARVTGSRDLFPQADRMPTRSINFITCHDGFTLRDLVSYNEKHNEANGEENRDGTNANYSWNCGVEGETDDPEINALRLRQQKNLLAILLLSQGTPMVQMGDEVGRSQQGNNNVYCQDNPLSWFNWELVEEHHGLFRFTRELIRLRKSLSFYRQRSFWGDEVEGRHASVTWHGVAPHAPDWGPASRALVFTLDGPDQIERLYFVINAYWEDLPLVLPEAGTGRSWHRVIDTAETSPRDIFRLADAPLMDDEEPLLPSRSVLVLLAK